MLSSYLLTLFNTTLTWLVLGLASLGLGLLLRRLFRPLGPLDLLGLCVAFWTGWAAMVALLQIWHLIFPVNRAALVLVLGLGGAGLVLEARSLAGLAREGVRRAPILVILLIPTLLWMANRSTDDAQQHYDAGLYYLSSLQWNSNYPIVPGLGNLHGRLAYNSAYFLYGALADQMFAGGAVHAGNGLLLLALLVQGLTAMVALVTGARLPRFAFWNALTLTPTLYLIIGGEDNAGRAYTYLKWLSPDVPIFVLGLVLAGLCLVLLFEAQALAPREQAYVCFALALLAFVGMAVKLSITVLAATMLVVGVGVTLWGQRRARRAWLSLLAPPLACGLVVGGVWMVRGVILSGYPAFPSTLGAFPVPWRVPTEVAINEANWIRSWARQPGQHWVTVLGNQAWLRPWLETVSPQVLRPLNLALVSGLIGAATLAGPRLPWRRIGLGSLWLLPTLPALVFWFVSAPDYRFAGATFWIIGLGLTMLAVRGSARHFAGGPPPVAVQLAVVAMALLWVAPVRPPLFRVDSPSALFDWQSPRYQPQYILARTNSGLSVRVPLGTDQCWALPLPCTPYLRPGLRLREPGNLASGFIVDTRRKYVDESNYPPLPVSAPASLGVSLPVGWYPYEPEYRIRWMQDEGLLLLYSDAPRRLQLALHPHNILGPGGWQNHGHLLVTVEGAPAVEADVEVGKITTLSLAIKAGFTRVGLRLEGGARVPSEVIPGYGDGRRLSLALSRIELSDE